MAPLLAGCKVTLDHNLSERQSNAIVALLLSRAVPAAKHAEKNDQFSVVVDQGDFARAYALQRAHGLPQRAQMSAASIFNHDGLVASPAAERAKFLFAQEQQLDQAIQSISGVVSAHVLLVQPPSDPLARNNAAPSASVLINIAPGSISANLLPRIKMLVAHGVRGLGYGHVTVVAVADPLIDREAKAPLVSVFGLWVARADANLLRAGIGLVMVILGALLVAFGYRLWRARRRIEMHGRRLIAGVLR